MKYDTTTAERLKSVCSLIRVNWFRIGLVLWLAWFSVAQNRNREEIEQLSSEVSQLSSMVESSEIGEIKDSVDETKKAVDNLSSRIRY
jgi:hypothetical protein